MKKSEWASSTQLDDAHSLTLTAKLLRWMVKIKVRVAEYHNFLENSNENAKLWSLLSVKLMGKLGKFCLCCVHKEAEKWQTIKEKNQTHFLFVFHAANNWPIARNKLFALSLENAYFDDLFVPNVLHEIVWAHKFTIDVSNTSHATKHDAHHCLNNFNCFYCIMNMFKCFIKVPEGIQFCKKALSVVTK